MPPLTSIICRNKRMRMRLRLPEDRKKKMKRTVEESPEDRKKRTRMMLPAINIAASAQAEADRKKRITLSVLTGEELEAEKAEWRAQYLKSDPDRVPPWKSRYGAGMEDEMQWPPIWKERIDECPEYEVLRYYLHDLANHPRYKNSETYRMLAEQMRESRGYGVTVGGCGFCVFSPGMVSEFSPTSRVVCKYVTDQINERAQNHGEFYVFDGVMKIAMAPLFICFFTFTVEEATSHELKTVQAYVLARPFFEKMLVYLKEWRFKPE